MYRNFNSKVHSYCVKDMFMNECRNLCRCWDFQTIHLKFSILPLLRKQLVGVVAVYRRSVNLKKTTPNYLKPRQSPWEIPVKEPLLLIHKCFQGSFPRFSFFFSEQFWMVDTVLSWCFCFYSIITGALCTQKKVI